MKFSENNFCNESSTGFEIYVTRWSNVRSSRALLDAGCLAPGCWMLRAWMPDAFLVVDPDADTEMI